MCVPTDTTVVVFWSFVSKAQPTGTSYRQVTRSVFLDAVLSFVWIPAKSISLHFATLLKRIPPPQIFTLTGFTFLEQAMQTMSFEKSTECIVLITRGILLLITLAGLIGTIPMDTERQTHKWVAEHSVYLLSKMIPETMGIFQTGHQMSYFFKWALFSKKCLEMAGSTRSSM